MNFVAVSRLRIVARRAPFLAPANLGALPDALLLDDFADLTLALRAAVGSAVVVAPGEWPAAHERVSPL